MTEQATHSAQGLLTRPPLTMERTTVIILFALLFALAARIQVDSDMWWHLRVGQYIVETGSVPTVDYFSYTRLGAPRIPAEWLTQAAMYGIWTALGDFGMVLFTAALATLGMFIIFQTFEGSTYLRAFVAVLTAATAAVFWSARPQMLSFVMTALVVYILYLYKRRDTDRLWLLPAVLLLWPQLHGGWVLGLVVLGGTVVGEALNNLLRSGSAHVLPWPRIIRLAAFSAVSAAVVVINPVGLDLLLLPLQTFTMGALRAFIQEWLPPNFAMPEVWPFLLLLVLTALALLADWRRLDWTEVLLFGAASYLALTVSRNISFFALIAAPILTHHLADLMQRRGWVLRTVTRPTRRMQRINTAIVVVIVLGCVAKVLLVMEPITLREARLAALPVEAVAYLAAEQPPGPMFNSYNWGGYLMFFAQDYLVYIDGRTDLYTDRVFEFARIWAAGEGWQDALDGVNLVIVEAQSGLGRALRETPGWRLAHEDALAVVYVRENTDDGDA